MRRPAAGSSALIATLISSLAAGRPLVLPDRLETAGGARLAVVVIALDAPSQAARGLLETALTDAARAQGSFEVLGPVDVFDGPAAATRQTKLEAARASVIAGKKALDDLDTGKASQLLAEAVASFKEADTRVVFDELVKALVLKAASHAIAGEVAPARQEMERVLAVAPRAEFDAQFFPPELIKFAESQRKMSVGSKGELVVRTEPHGASVWVDGTFRGASPVTVAGLATGKHFVATGLGGQSLALAEVPLGESTLELKAADPQWKKTVDTVSRAPQGPGRDVALVALGKKLGVEQVLAAVVKKSTAGAQFELIVLRLEVRDGHNLGYGTATVPLTEVSEPLTRAFDVVLSKDTPRQGKTPVTHFEGAASGGSGKTIAGIALLGVAVALVAVGIGTGAAGQDRYQQFRNTPQVQTSISQGYANEARALGAVSLGSFIGAGAAAGVGTFLLSSGGGSSTVSEETAPKKKPARTEKPKPTEKPAERPVEKPAEKPVEKPRDEKDEARRAKEEKDERARLKREEEQRARDEAEAQKRAEEDKRRLEADLKKGGKKADEARRKAEAEAEARKQQEDEARRRKDEEDRRRKEDEERRKREEDAKKKPAEDDHDDLRNF